MRRIVLLVLLSLIPAGQACSLASQDFTWADLGDNVLVTHLNQDGVRIDLDTGRQSVISQDFFPRHSVDDDGRWIALQGQVGLGADCSGDVYFRIDGTPLDEDGVDAHDVGSKHVAVLKGTSLAVYRLGTWVQTATYVHPVASNGFGGSEPRTIAVADDGRVAATTPDKVMVYGPKTLRYDIADARAVDWFGDDLVIATSQGQGATFHIMHADGTSRFEIDSDEWGQVQIAAGKDLYVAYRNTVLHIDGQQAKRLQLSGFDMGGIAADDDGAVVLLLEDTEHGWGDAKAIQRLDGRQATGHLVQRNGAWQAVQGPTLSWGNGPAITTTGDVPGQDPGAGEDAPAPAVGIAILGLAGIVAARRLR